jgi:hypothetical protein
MGPGRWLNRLWFWLSGKCATPDDIVQRVTLQVTVEADGTQRTQVVSKRRYIWLG